MAKPAPEPLPASVVSGREEPARPANVERLRFCYAALYEREDFPGDRFSLDTFCFVCGNSDDFGKLSDSLYVRLYRPHF